MGARQLGVTAVEPLWVGRDRRMPELVGGAVESSMTETLRQATGGQASARPAGSPLSTPLTPRPNVPTMPPERGAER